MSEEDIRDPRSAAPEVAINLDRKVKEIDRELRKKFPDAIHLWWELEPSNRIGWAYHNGSKILCKLVHAKG